MSDCEHAKRFKSVFFMPKEDRGCLACGFERVNTELTQYRSDLAERDKVARDRLKHVEELTVRVQYLVDHWPVPVEDGGITFPDGEFWKTSS